MIEQELGMIEQLNARLELAEKSFGEWMSTHTVALLRVSMGIVFLWFGVLKFWPGLSDAEVLATKTIMTITFGLIPAKVCIQLLAVAECAMGGMMVAGRALRLTTLCLMLHLMGTFLPMMLFPGETWKHFPYAPTLLGQYILKNLILMAVTSTLR